MTPMQQFSVAGAWRETRERFLQVYNAATPRGAEDLAQLEAHEKGGTLWVCRVVPGDVKAADLYTAFIDPNDPRNDGRDDLVPDTPDLVAGDPEWTVYGIALPPGIRAGDVPRLGERYGDVLNATSAGAAEDVARARLADKGGELWVCCVLPGRVAAVDTYASFVDPEVKAVSR
jgi:hypothetical protein